ncbi:MAG: DUF3866 family protein [Brevibacillus sp.]|nr:DUF3866 family protein [Brevibacillus sp.]
MLQVVSGTVKRVLEETEGMQLLEVVVADADTQADPRHEQAYFFRRGSERCTVGERVLLNVTAERLGLGTGGSHFVMAKESDRPADYHHSTWGHIVKLRYSPWQLVVDAVEEQNSPWHELFCDPARHLERTPVLIGELHSLLPAIVLALKEISPSVRLAYVMPDCASLPIALSRHVRYLKERGLLAGTVTTGHAWGGDLEAVNLYTGLLAARHVTGADLILCLPGPGIVGTGTLYGFSGMQLAEAIHAVSLLGGVPVSVPRISFADSRSRHQGLSHHTRTLLGRITLVPSLLALPRFADWRDQVIAEQARVAGLFLRHVPLMADVPSPTKLADLVRDYPEPITSMGRDSQHDPSPVQTAYAAAMIADHCLKWVERQRSSVSGASLGRDELTNLANSWTYGTADAE